MYACMYVCMYVFHERISHAILLYIYYVNSEWYTFELAIEIGSETMDMNGLVSVCL